MNIPSSYLNLIRTRFPDLNDVSFSINRDGLFNDVIIVNDAIVFRFPKNAEAKRTLAAEAKVLDVVRRFVAMPVPRFEQCDGDCVAYQLIPGQALQRDDILRQEETAQDLLARQIAIFLQQLHTIPQPLLEEENIQAAGSVRSREDWIALFHDVEREMFPLLMSHAQEWVIRHFIPVLDRTLDLRYDPALVHGDLGPYHILYDPATRRINGVIDFGTAGLGDPADDFANIIHAFGESFLKRMSLFYPAIEHALNRARFWAGTLDIQWALAGLRSGDRSWFLVHIGRAQDMLPVETGHC
jgi:aminoglycoside 2''-phosphotransferase